MHPKEQTNPFSRVVHTIDSATSRPATAVVVAVAIFAFGLVLAAVRFPASWQTAFATESGADAELAELEQAHLEHRLAIRDD